MKDRPFLLIPVLGCLFVACDPTVPAAAGPKDMGFSFTIIPAGRFQLGIHKDLLVGSAKNMPFLREDEPYRSASVARPFLIKATEVTWAEWNKVRDHAGELGYTDLAAGRNGYHGDDSGEHPVTEVSWWDAVKWCNLLSEIEGKKPVYYSSEPFDKDRVLRAGEPEAIAPDWNSGGYRLPTEAEWEYAWWHAGRAQGHPEPDGWHLENSEQNTHPAASRPSSSSKKLHDMTGNVAEWCWDWIGPVTPHGYEADPKGPPKGRHRMVRGGSWADHPMCCRGTYRGNFSPKLPSGVFTGFRPVRLQPPAR